MANMVGEIQFSTQSDIDGSNYLGIIGGGSATDGLIVSATGSSTVDNIVLYGNTQGTSLIDSGISLSTVDRFGSEYESTEVTLASTTSSPNVYTEYISFTTASKPAGTYRISWYFERANNSTMADFIARVILDKTVFGTSISGTFSVTNGNAIITGTTDVINEIFPGDLIEVTNTIPSESQTFSVISYNSGTMEITVDATWTGTTSAGLTIAKANTLGKIDSRTRTVDSNIFVSHNIPNLASRQRDISSGFRTVVFTGVGTHHLSLQYSTNTASTFSGIQNGRIDIYRVA